MKNDKKIFRKLRHQRKILNQGFSRSDGLYDIESIIIDTKSYDIPRKNRNPLTAGQPLHEMIVKLTIDMNLKIISAEARTESAPYKICKQANSNIKNLIGETIGPGWRKKVHSSIGGTNGCTHVRELLISMATVAFQTLYGERSRLKREAISKGLKDPFPEKAGVSPLLNSCFAFDEKSEVTKDLWPDYWVE